MPKLEVAMPMFPGTTASRRWQSAPESNEVEKSDAPNQFVGNPGAALQSLAGSHPSLIVFAARQSGR